MEASLTNILIFNSFRFSVKFAAITRHVPLRFGWACQSHHCAYGAHSTSRLGDIPSISRIFVKLEDSSSSTISFRCAIQLTYSSSAVYFFFFIQNFFCLTAQFPQALWPSWTYGKPQAWAHQELSEGMSQSLLRSLQIRGYYEIGWLR